MVNRDELAEDLTDMAERGLFGNAVENIVGAVVDAVLAAVDADPATEPDAGDDQAGERVLTLIDLPDDAVPYAVIEIVGFFDSDGDSLLGYRFNGDVAWTTQLGLLEAAKSYLTRVYQRPDD